MFLNAVRGSRLALSVPLACTVFVVTGAARATDSGVHFVHVTTTESISYNTTNFHHPLTDSNPDAIIQVTQSWSPAGSSGVENDRVLGVWYTGSGWSIFNQGLENMPMDAGFNVWIPPADGSSFVHTVGESGHISTSIDNPLTNGNPDVILCVTQNWNPPGSPGIYNDSVIGVNYSSGNRWWIYNVGGPEIPEGASFNVTVLPAAPTVFVHTYTAGSIAASRTIIDHPMLNSNPNAILSVTPRVVPANNHTTAVWYDGTQWSIINQDLAALPDGVSFNVLAPPVSSAQLVHRADDGSTSGNATQVDHPLANGNPNAIIFATQSWNPGGSNPGTYNDHPIGVYYSSVSSRWSVFNQDDGEMPEGASFNLSIPAVGASTFTHTATSGNTNAYWTWFDHPATNGNTYAQIHVTQNLTPGAVWESYNNHHIGVLYDNSVGRWAVSNQDFTAMPMGASFNFMTSDATFLHVANSGNIFYNYTVIDRQSCNGNPYAQVHVTQNLSPFNGNIGVYNDHEIGVWYTGSHWAIFNQDQVAMPGGAAFNVTVFDPRIFTDGFESGDTSQWSTTVQ